MSEYEKHKGKLIRVSDEYDKPIAEQMKWILDMGTFHRMTKDILDGMTIEEWICNNYFEKLLISNGILYQIEDECIGDGDLNIFEEESDGVYRYINTFYNGGTCLDEILEDNLKNI